MKMRVALIGKKITENLEDTFVSNGSKVSVHQFPLKTDDDVNVVKKFLKKGMSSKIKYITDTDEISIQCGKTNHILSVATFIACKNESEVKTILHKKSSK